MAGTHDVRDYGAAGTGRGRDTAAIQAALDACAGKDGTVVVPPGAYRTGPLTVGDRTTLELRAGATVEFVRDHEAFASKEGRWEGWIRTGFHPCLLVEGAEDVAITGDGTLDGQGDYWWQYVDATPPPAIRKRLAEFRADDERSDDVSAFTLRPPLVRISRSENVTLSGVTLRNSPFWSVHVAFSEAVTVRDVTIEAPPDAPNADGVDVDSSRDVRIEDCDVDVGDDAVCVKSGKDAEGRRIGRPAAGVTVTDCTVRAGHGGVVVGSETAGDVRDVAVEDCRFVGTDRGIRIKTCRGRGGVVEDLRFEGIEMDGVACPITVNGRYFGTADGEAAPVDEGTPLVRDVRVEDVTARGAATAGVLLGLPERPFEDVALSNVRIEVIDEPNAGADIDVTPAMVEGLDRREGLYCRSMEGISLQDVRIETPTGPALVAAATGTISIDGQEIDCGQSDSVTVVEDVAGPTDPSDAE